MKVRLPKDYKSIFTLEQLEQAKLVIAAEKDDDETVKGWAGYAIREALKDEPDYLVDVLKADATVAGNCRIWNQYSVFPAESASGKMDVWIEATAETTEGFIKIGAYLSDIWQTGGTDYREHMYIQRYGKI